MQYNTLDYNVNVEFGWSFKNNFRNKDGNNFYVQFNRKKIQKNVVQDPEIQCISVKIMVEKSTGCVNQVLLMKITTKLNSRDPETHDT